MKLGKEFRTGVFVILILTASVLTVNYLRGNGFFQKSRFFITSYTDVQGLNPATPVYISGFKAGSVASVKFDKARGVFDIRLNVSGDFDIPSDSGTEIFSSDILGGKSIRIIYGTSEKMAESGDRLEGFVCEDPLSSMIAGIGPIMEKIDTLAANLVITVNNINSILNETNRNEINALVGSFRRSVQNIETLTCAIKEKSPEIQSLVTNLTELSGTLKVSADKLDSTLANVEDITCELKDADLKETVGDLDRLIKKLQDSEGSLGKLMSTDSLHNSINSLIIDIDSLVNIVKENPRKNLKFSVF